VEGLAPTGVVSDTRQPVFHWTDVPEAQDYRLLLYRNGGFFHRQVVEGATQWPSSLQLPYGRYRWWVRGRKHDGVGPWSEPKVFFIGRCTPVSPAGDLATPPDTLTWQAGPAVAAAWYELRIDFDGWLFWRRWVRATDVAVAGDERSYPLPTEAQPLPPGPLTWRVRTWNRSDGYGPWSERLAFSVPAPAP
jgi:hypothetical protein